MWAGSSFLVGVGFGVLAAGHTHADGEALFVEHAFGVELGQLGEGHEGGALHFFAAGLAVSTDDLELAERIALGVGILLIK